MTYPIHIMYEWELSKYLRNYTKIKPNPFLNKNFYLTACESFTDGSEVHEIGDVRMVYRGMECEIKFSSSELIIGCYLLVSVESDGFGYDPESLVMCDGRLMEYPKNTNIIQKFNFVIDFCAENSCTKLKLIYSSREDGIDAFEYNKALIYYIIDEDHDDNFYYIKEYNRWSGK